VVPIDQEEVKFSYIIGDFTFFKVTSASLLKIGCPKVQVTFDTNLLFNIHKMSDKVLKGV